MNQEELNSILELHRKWLYSEKGGKRADLRDADMSGAELRGANLRAANLCGADLSDADLRDADLWRANLRGANLWRANLCGANLWRANLCGADLSDADLRDAKNLTDIQCARLSIVPEEGSFIAWKQARYWDEDELYSCIIKLEIPADAKRCNATGRKCRASKARVVEIQDMEVNRLDPSFEVVSCHDHSFHYLPGVTVEPREPFCEDRWNECSSGIHFYITREEAVHHL